jgi:ribosome-binding ATPase YchF (GTP1/OBG family)
VLNVGDDAAAAAQLLADVRRGMRDEGRGEGRIPHPSSLTPHPLEWLALPGQLEMELAELDPAEAEEFIAAMGIGELSAGGLIEAAYHLLDRVCFLTVGPDEVRAWPIPRGSTAPEAAAAIHTDLARGFIRAEVVTYEDLVAAGGMTEARKLGKLRSEGKAYVVQDGDVINILFHV